MNKRQATKLLPVVRRRALMSGVSFVVIVAVWILLMAMVTGAGLLGRAGGPSTPVIPTTVGTFVPVVLLAGAFLLVNFVYDVRLRKLAATAGYKLCPKCTYDLSASTSAERGDQCPECGFVTEGPKPEELWRAWCGDI